MMDTSIHSAELKLASIQMVSTPKLKENMDTASQLVSAAARDGAKLVVLPEYFCLMGNKDTDKVRAREAYGSGPIQDELAMMAEEHGFQTSTERYQESETIEAGDKPGSLKITVDGQEWTFGLSICYDLRFPELYRALGQVDCHIIPAAFTYTTGKDHWEILLRARAIENQCYVLASAQGGTHENQRRTWGNTMLIDPWGTILENLPAGEGFISGVLCKDKLNEVRSKLPALAHRKL